MIHRFSFFFFLFLFLIIPDTSDSSFETMGSPKKRSISSVNNKTEWLSKRQEVQLGGVLIVFHRWPKKKERRRIFLETRKEHLKRAESVSKPKMWSFEWLSSKNKSLKNFTSFTTALGVCEKITKLDSVKYCRLEFIPLLHKGFSQQDSMIHSGIPSETSCKKEVFDVTEKVVFDEDGHQLTSDPRTDPFWGQKMIGSDLAREAMEGVNHLPENDPQNLLSIIDGRIDVGIGTHEELVRSVAVGEGAQAVAAPAGNETGFYNYKRIQEHISHSNDNYIRCSSGSSKRSCQRRYFPAIANLSFGLTDSEGFLETLKNLYGADKRQFDSNSGPFYSKLMGRNVDPSKTADQMEFIALSRALERNFRSPDPFYMGQSESLGTMSKRGTVIIQSSGNKGNKPIDKYTVKAAREYGAIVVGSVNPRGERAGFSQTGSSVFIMAPGESITVSNNKGEFHQKDGTSLSSPMASGALRNFILASGYRPTSDEAKKLFEETAIPHNADPGNGVGIVNAYKMAEVGKRLYILCGGNESCVNERIKQSATYTFRPNSTELLNETEMYFPQCASQPSTPPPLTILCDRNCPKKAEILKQLRKHFLLNPKDSKIAEYLACIYSSHGYEDTAKFYLGNGNYGHLRQALRCGRQPSHSRDRPTRSTHKGTKVSN